MSLPRYGEYKDSSFDWAVEVPAHWGTASLKWLSQRYSGGTPDKNRLEFWEDGTIPWLNSGAVNDGRIYEASAYITQDAFENSSAKWIPSGALVMALAGQGKTKGMVAQLMFRSTCNQSMAAIIPTDRIDARYLYWWLTCNYQNIRNMAGGDLRDGLNLELLGAIPCPLPPPVEQTAITAFLDRETAKIDALIAEQQKLIALLAEKRQATISHAVTRGLNPNAPMKDSGVAWLGEVPAHWEVRALRRVIAAIEQGWSPECHAREAEATEWGVLKAGCLNGGVFRPSENKALPPDLAPEQKYEVRAGDVLMSRASGSPELVGSTALVATTRPGLMLSDKIFRLHLQEVVTPRYFVAAMGSLALRTQIENALSGGNGMANNLPQSSLLAFLMTVPPHDEQHAIVDFIDREIGKLNRLGAASERAIALLKERRSALIAAAVTGQIDVRDT